MKKFLFTMFLMVLGASAFAQKEYVFVKADDIGVGNYISLYGAIPSGMESRYAHSENIGNVLNKLAQKGFVVEQMTGDYNAIALILSRNISNPSNIIQQVPSNTDQEVVEVARYNLQGMPIGKNEKGVQIVVYSNYTTKTIIVE